MKKQKKAEIPVSRTRNSARGISAQIDEIRTVEGQITAVLLEMQEKVQSLETLNEFSSLLNSTLDTQVVREKALEATCRLVRCETASLYLVDPAKAELYWETALGDVGNELKKSVRLPINDQSIAGYVAMTGESVIVNDVENDPRHFKRRPKSGENAQVFRTRTMVCVPLINKGKVVGVLQALNKLPSAPLKKSQHAWADFQADDQSLLQTLGHQVAIAIENSRLYMELKQSFFETVEALAEAIEKKDHYTGGHTKRVVFYSMCIAKYLDLTTDELERIKLGAILHDVGKIGIEDKILKKEAPLERTEWEVMQKHPELGYDIMNRVSSLQDVMGGMRYHHERWDGEGYPLGLKGEEIPFLARIIAVADTYDAMVSTRPYRKGLDPQLAFEEITQKSGTQFDPQIVEAFRQAFQNGKMGRGSTQAKLSNAD